MKITDEMKELLDAHEEILESSKDKDKAINYLKSLELVLAGFKSVRSDLMKFYEKILCDTAA